MRLILSWLVVCWSSAIMLTGCASWQQELPEESFRLPKARLSRDSVILDIRFVNLTGGEESGAELAEMWSELDEQHLEQKLRQRLAVNGFRAGVFGSHLPQALRDRLASSSTNDATHHSDDLELTHRRLQTRPRKRNEIVATSPRESLTVFLNSLGEVRGQTFHNAQCMFGLRTYPLGDGRVRLELTPQIQHGVPRQKWASGNGVFQYVASRDQQEYKELRLAATLSPGETLAMTSSHIPKGLGKLFFLAGSDTGTRQRMLLIRLSQSQWDNLFDPEPLNAPLATSERE